MKNIVLIIALTFSGISFAQDFKNDFKKYFQEKDTLRQKEILQKWEKAKPKDPELYTSFFNYYFQKARTEVLSLTTNQPNGESLVLQDSLEQKVGYLGSTITYDDSNVNDAFSKINKGISLYPDRLDMRFGKIYALGKIKDWTNFTTEIIATVNYSVTNKNHWTWTNDTNKDDGKEFMLSSIQSYQIQLYNTERDDLLVNMREIALTILKHYPDHIESLSNLSITYFLIGEFEKGIEALFKAEKINPKDAIVLSNIANGYKQIGNKAKSIEYYEKTISYGDENIIAFAKKQIEELKK